MNDINQSDLKQRIGAKNINTSKPTTGINYANRINMRAMQRMERYRRSIGTMDALQAINRFKWSALPLGLRSKLIERICYYRGSAMFYFDADLDRFFFLPYALTSEGEQHIDFYGQYTLVKPMPFNGKSTDSRNATKKAGKKEVYLGLVTRTPVYDIEELKALIKTHGADKCKKECCIILRDYTQGLIEYNIPRSTLQEALIDFQSECLPMMRTAMLKACMPKLIKASDEGVVDSLLAELQSIEDAIIEGKTAIPVAAFQDLQDIDSKNSGQVIESMMKSYESINNIRKTFLGIPNDGAFKKNSHVLQDEQDTNQKSSDGILDDSLELRQEFAEMVNLLFGLQIQVDKKELAAAGEAVEDEGEPSPKDETAKANNEGGGE